MVNIQRESSSFRDPSGFLFWQNKKLYRSIDNSYKKDYEFFINSGLYNKLVEENLIIFHKEAKKFDIDNSYKVIQPQFIPFISYPYEWSFSQLKDAA
ncbi:MAG: SAM-dependent methyltransferase, partial [Candidatus Helarchaeota archaeon]